MTKKQLLDFISQYPDSAEVVIIVHDTTLHEDLYDFTLGAVHWKFKDGTSTGLQMHEIQLCPIKNTNK